MTGSLSAITLLVVVATLGCKEPSKTVSRYQLIFHVTDDRSEALDGVPIFVGETRIGATGATGSLQAEVNAYAGDRYPLRAPCPDDHTVQERPEEIVFLNTAGPGGEKNAEMDVQIVCKRHIQVAAVVVHADGHPGLPVLVDGVRKGVTGPGGFAHLRLEGASGAQFQLSLDTGSYPWLVPQNPGHQMQLGSADGLFIFEPVFAQAEASREGKPRHRRSRRGSSKQSDAEPAR